MEAIYENDKTLIPAPIWENVDSSMKDEDSINNPVLRHIMFEKYKLEKWFDIAIIISKQAIEYDKELKHLKDISVEAKNLVQALEGFFDVKTTRSQLNKALKKVKYLTIKDIL